MASSEDVVNTKVEVPEWLATDSTANMESLELRDIMILYLYPCPDSLVMSKARRLVNAQTLAKCKFYIFICTLRATRGKEGTI